ncbi:hypothetical protein KHQ81_13290 [Mycoplasmatota bacterium]|nr:hypothetical protein KHQ81_13290 [Mycoplasmatota bacterium]
MLYRNRKKILSSINKDIIFKSNATYFIGSESIGGYLILTEEELIFRPYKNNTNEILLIPKNELIRIERISSVGIFPNGMLIFTEKNVFHFIVFKRKQWMIKIDNIIKNIK